MIIDTSDNPNDICGNLSAANKKATSFGDAARNFAGSHRLGAVNVADNQNSSTTRAPQIFTLADELILDQAASIDPVLVADSGRKAVAEIKSLRAELIYMRSAVAGLANPWKPYYREGTADGAKSAFYQCSWCGVGVEIERVAGMWAPKPHPKNDCLFVRDGQSRD